MPIKHAVVHGLTINESQVDIHLNDQELALNESVEDLVYRIKSSFYGRSSKQYGQFDETGRAISQAIRNVSDGKTPFVEASHQIMESFASLIKDESLSTQGYWLVVQEALEQGEFFWLCQFKSKDELSVTDNLGIDGNSVIDFSKLGFAAQINLSDMADDSVEKYITVSFGFGDRALQAGLCNYIGFTETVSPTEDTKVFMDVVKAFSDTMPKEKGAAYQKKAAEFCVEQSKAGETVAYQAISDELVNDTQSTATDSLSSFILEKKPDIKEHFIPDQKSLKKFIRFSGKSKEVSISFNNDTLGNAIEFDAEKEHLVIKQLPATLLKQLKALNEAGDF
ncbi:nucleoid-associated protein [Reinekea forsetii]|nr:nucleoid-associated protein [Reinekea forsetii]